ncbi:cytochrome b5-like [Symsagittifera roscoffensis]|uniref:cytochrome b5-like n=1 Tax=Symsagittifera roscoffensis TaxID=84072 RepID=UPI00307BE7D9
MSETIVSESELAQHNSIDDLWVAVEDKVYNLTQFQFEHPGGSDILVEVAGKDATEEFEDAGHSEDAREMMESYLVGKLEDSAKPKSGKKKPPSLSDGSSPLSSYLVYGGIAIGVVIIACVLLNRRTCKH